MGKQNFILVEEKSCWVQATVALILATIVITAINRSLHNAMTNTAVSISQADIQALEQLYTLRERTEVVEFLDKHPFLIPVLLKAPEKIRHYFPDDSQLFLEVFVDPESIDWVQLVLSILINLDPQDALKRLNQLDWDWGIHNSYEVRSNFFTTLEYPDEF